MEKLWCWKSGPNPKQCHSCSFYARDYTKDGKCSYLENLPPEYKPVPLISNEVNINIGTTICPYKSAGSKAYCKTYCNSNEAEAAVAGAAAAAVTVTFGFMGFLIFIGYLICKTWG